VYIAIAGAIAAASPIESALFMAFFGLGTLPLLWAVSFFGHLVTLKVRRVFKWTYPIIIFTMACIMILRGFGVHITTQHNNTNPATSWMSIECGKN
jgi:sulfite exporter TauE/SafE